MPDTFGEKTVGIKFNPSGKGEVADAKRMMADFIDVVQRYSETRQSTAAKRCCSIAITHAETACMFAVKAMTSD